MDPISLMYCGNDRVFCGMLLSLISVSMHTERPLDVHILTMDGRRQDPRYAPVTDRQAAYLETVLKTAHPDSRVTRHDCGELYERYLAGGPNAESVYTPYALLRLVIDRVEGLPNRLLYLDTDTVATGDIAALFDRSIAGYDFAAARDFLGRIFISPRYMNTGVMLLSLPQIRQSGLMDRARALYRRRRFPFPDQDVLNRCVQKKCFLPRRFNEQYRQRPDTVIRHFSKTIRLLPVFHTVNIKPWDIEGIRQVYRTAVYDGIFARYQAAMSHWKEENHAATRGTGRD